MTEDPSSVVSFTTKLEIFSNSYVSHGCALLYKFCLYMQIVCFFLYVYKYIYTYIQRSSLHFVSRKCVLCDIGIRLYKFKAIKIFAINGLNTEIVIHNLNDNVYWFTAVDSSLYGATFVFLSCCKSDQI